MPAGSPVSSTISRARLGLPGSGTTTPKAIASISVASTRCRSSNPPTACFASASGPRDANALPARTKGVRAPATIATRCIVPPFRNARRGDPLLTRPRVPIRLGPDPIPGRLANYAFDRRIAWRTSLAQDILQEGRISSQRRKHAARNPLLRCLKLPSSGCRSGGRSQEIHRPGRDAPQGFGWPVRGDSRRQADLLQEGAGSFPRDP